MSIVDLSAALELRLKNGWTRTPVKWPNIRFIAPVDTANNPQPFIAFNLRIAPNAEDLVLGSANPEWRSSGVALINIFVPENTGMALSRLYADLIRMLFLQQPRDFSSGNSGIIRLYVPQVIEIGTVAGWAQTNVVIPFKNDFRQ